MFCFKKFRFLFVFVIIALLCGCQTEKTTLDAPPVVGNFEFTVLKIGQADAIVLQTENSNMVIDLGEKDDGDEIIDFLASKNIDKIDYLFITHFDKDHIGGFPQVMENIAADWIIAPNYTGNNDSYQNYLETIKNQNLTITTCAEDTSFTVDDVLIEISTPKRQNYKEGDNDFSLVLSVTHGENTFLFAGDVEEDRIPEVLTHLGRPHKFLKMPHHGKFNENTTRFINTIKPEYAVITDSDKNPASDKTTKLLESRNTKIYTTRGGNVYVSSDGAEISIIQ